MCNGNSNKQVCTGRWIHTVRLVLAKQAVIAFGEALIQLKTKGLSVCVFFQAHLQSFVGTEQLAFQSRHINHSCRESEHRNGRSKLMRV